jgi:hypothetical protein
MDTPGGSCGHPLTAGFCAALRSIVVFSLTANPPPGDIPDEFEIAATKPIYEE